MIVTCPACKRKYRLDDGLVKSPYQKMRCSQCGQVFVNHENQGMTGEKLSTGHTTILSAVEKPLSMRRGKGMALVVSVLVFFGLVVAGYLYWMNYLGAGNRWLSIPLTRLEGHEADAKDGPVFLINGTVVNGSTKPRRRVVLKAKLFDESGAVIGQHFAVAGTPLSADELAGMMKSDIEERAKAAMKSDQPGLALYPHKEMPFSVVLPGPYQSKPKEFSVEIVDSPFP